MGTLPFVTIDQWTIIFGWVNLLILFLLMKKFLFKPIKAMLDARENEVQMMYAKADESRANAEALEEEYTEKLSTAREEAAQMMQTATRNAQLRSEEILKESQDKAAAMLVRADKQIEQEKRSAVSDIKREIATMAVSIASKVVEKDLTAQDYTRLVDDFIDKAGDGQ